MSVQLSVPNYNEHGKSRKKNKNKILSKIIKKKKEKEN